MADEPTTATAPKGEPTTGAEPTTPEAQPVADEALRDAGKAALQKERDRAEAAEKELKRLQREQAKRDEAEATAKGEWEKVAKAREDEVNALKGEIAKRDREALRAKVAAAHKLPADLAALLQGEDEGALTESAKLLAKHVVARTAPDTEAGAGSKGSSGPSDKPVRKESGGEKTPAYTFDGKAKVAWPSR